MFKNNQTNQIKIIDFGLGKNNFENMMQTYLGTPYYIAPEII